MFVLCNTETTSHMWLVPTVLDHTALELQKWHGGVQGGTTKDYLMSIWWDEL